MEEFKNAFASLEGAEVIDKELNPLAYNPDDYPGVETCVDFVLKNSHKEPKQINLGALSRNGLAFQDEMKTYLAKDFISSSALKQALINPASYYFYMNDRQNFTEKEKAHFEFGTFAHMAFLEPELFNKTAIEPNFSLASKDGCKGYIRFYENLNKEASLGGIDDLGLPELKARILELKERCQFALVQEEHKLMIDILKRNYYLYGGGIIPMLLKGAISEVSFYGQDPDTGLNVKTRADAINIKENIGVDAVISLKTTRAESLSKFYYDTAKLKYELSEGMYQENISHITGRKFNTTIMIMLQSVPPFQIAVLWWNAEDLQNGKYKYHHALNTVYECQDKGIWPGFDSMAEQGNYGIIEMQQPEWAKKLIHPVDISDD